MDESIEDFDAMRDMLRGSLPLGFALAAHIVLAMEGHKPAETAGALADLSCTPRAIYEASEALAKLVNIGDISEKSFGLIAVRMLISLNEARGFPESEEPINDD